jgi:hypothetical protein
LSAGDRIWGRVRNIVDYGAFIDLPLQVLVLSDLVAHVIAAFPPAGREEAICQFVNGVNLLVPLRETEIAMQEQEEKQLQ